MVLGINSNVMEYDENIEYFDSETETLIKKTEMTTAKHYVRCGTSCFSFVDDVLDQIESGFYRPEWDAYNQKAYLIKRDITIPKLYHLPDDIFETILNDITHFWESEERYKAFGNVYKRNILLYSVPGNGKTSLINMLSFELIEKYNGIILTINSTQDLTSYPKCIERIRQIEPSRPIITIIEDFDGLVVQDKNAETLLLQILDGNNQYSKVVTIATTNHIDQIQSSFTNRPSRFNMILEYKKPNEKVRRYYITNKLQDSGIDVSTQEVIDTIERLVKISDNYTFDYVKELLELIYVMEYTEEQAVERLTEAISKKGDYKISEDIPSQIGFL